SMNLYRPTPKFLSHTPHKLLSAVKRKRLHKPIVRGMPDTDVFACHANAALDLVVVGLNVFVRDWPIVAITIMSTRFEIKIAITRNAASPHKRLPTDDLGTHPVVRLP